MMLLRIYVLGNSGSEICLWYLSEVLSRSEGSVGEPEADEVWAGRGINAGFWFAGICCCCWCTSTCLCWKNGVRLCSMGAFKRAKLDTYSLDSWMLLSSFWPGPWKEKLTDKNSLSFSNMYCAGYMLSIYKAYSSLPRYLYSLSHFVMV